MKIGRKLKEIRKSRKITLKELSEKSGVQIATLSRMEHDIMTGTLQSHIDICGALEIPLSEFYREFDNKQKTDTHKKEKPEPHTKSHNAITEILASNLSDKKMMPVIVRIKKRSRTQKEKAKHGTERFVYVLEGKVKTKIGGEEYRLSKGDSIYFDAAREHVFINDNRGDSAILSVTSPPVI